MIKKSDLAERCNLSAKTISQILCAKARITPETALGLEKVLGISASTWNNLEANYRLHQARCERRQELSYHKEWAKLFPLIQLTEWGFLAPTDDPIEQVDQLLNFLGVSTVDAWQVKISHMDVRFRRSTAYESSIESIATWLRIGEILAEKIECSPFNKIQFEKVLRDIKELTDTDPTVFQTKMIELCASAGVALVLFPELPKTHICGATQWLSKDKAIIILSLRYKTDDHLWFSFFHEAGHIILHGKKSIFIEGNVVAINEQENQANRFASDFLIPDKSYQELLNRDFRNAKEIISFVKR